MTGSVTSSKIRHFGLGLGAALAFFAAASSPALACNPFELLFGQCRETQVFRPEAPAYYEPAVRRRADTRGVDRPKPRVAHGAPTNSNGVSGKQKPIAATAAAPVGSLALFEKDRTLRTGDVVVTTTGFRVYEGGGSFAAIAHDGGRLATLEKVSFDRKTSGTFAKAAESVARTPDAASAPDVTAATDASSAPLRPSPVGLRTQARAASSGRIVASGG